MLTHEAIIDSTWDSAIKPLLLKRFPAATPDDLTAAHAYAYGGSIIQDLGYYPFGSKFYSDLTHYVRSGDFIVNLIRESQDLNEYAFALGALAHYRGGQQWPPHRHQRLGAAALPEASLEIRQFHHLCGRPVLAQQDRVWIRCVSSRQEPLRVGGLQRLHRFQVAKPVLQRAFQDTYGMKIEQVFLNLDLAIGSYRRAVGTILPALTKVAWQIKSQEIRKDAPGITRKKFLYNLSRSSYEKNWGSTYQRPGYPVENAGRLLPHRAQSGPLQGAGV